MDGSEIAVHYAALQIALVKAGELDASQELADWFFDNFPQEDLEELKEELDA